MRRVPKVAEVLPILNLRGALFTGGFKDALGARLGDDASGLSPTSITRLGFLSAGCTLGVLPLLSRHSRDNLTHQRFRTRGQLNVLMVSVPEID